jgi:hypothetical protein
MAERYQRAIFFSIFHRFSPLHSTLIQERGLNPAWSNTMTTLSKSLASWGSEGFSQTLKAEMEALESGVLPLEKGSNRGGPVDDTDLSVSVLGAEESADTLEAKTGVFFYEISAGGACGDAPLRENAYCVLQVSIDKATAEAEFTVIFE